MEGPIVILGAGLAGLSAAYHARKRGLRYLLVEKNRRPGGLVRSERVNGFCFDYTGHLLHMGQERTRALVLEELGLKEAFAPVRRDSWVYSHGRYTRAHFQTHLYGLPVGVVRECLEGALGAFLRRGEGPDRFRTFEEFNLATLGPGIYRHFMEPYNTKLWGVHPSEMTTEFLGRFVPRPSLTEIFEGALVEGGEPKGYNANFIYPKRVGIELLSRAFAERVSLRTSVEAESVDVRRRTVRLSDGTSVPYVRLVSTLPLPKLVERIPDAPARVRKAASLLRATSVLNVNLGVSNRDVSARQWVYVPGPELPFYRVGFYHNFSKALAPKGASSVYAEISYSKDRPLDKAAAPAAVKEGLRAMGILRKGDRIAAEWVADIPDAYVTYDRHRTPSVAAIQAWLQSQGIVSTGRWGNWEYAAMEDAIWQGEASIRSPLPHEPQLARFRAPA